MEFDQGAPIWRQLLDGFQRRIVAGVWAPGSQVPSVRDLAAEFAVNPNTVQKALAELERAGLAETQRGLGRFVTEDKDVIRRLGEELAEAATKEFVRTMKTLGIDQAQAGDLLKRNWKEGD